MKRYLDDNDYKRFNTDFQFLFEAIEKSKGELDIRLRGDYFNLYYKGHSLAKIKFAKEHLYKIYIHHKFITDKGGHIFSTDKRFAKKYKSSGVYDLFSIGADQLHAFLSKRNIVKISSNINSIESGELFFEQMLVTDNINNKNFIIIDRQITEHGYKKRLDLLGLKKITGNEYKFIALEVKLGNNPELRDSVAKQLEGYVKHIKSNFPDWRDNYEKVFHQMKIAGLFLDKDDSIKIMDQTEGWIIVMGYSGLGDKNIESLKKNYPDLIIKQFKYEL